MKLYLTILLFLTFVSTFFGQTPSASPFTPQPNLPEKIRTFGSSLKKYENESQQNFQANQNSNEEDNGEIIQIKTDLVINNVLVTDQNGEAITTLKKDDFIVMEDNAPQTIEIFSSSDNTFLARSIVLIIDCGAPQAPYLKNSIQAAKILVDELRPQDKMAIVTVDVKLRLDFTQNQKLLKRTLDSLEKKDIKLAGGAEFDALLAVLNEMFVEEDRQRILIFQGDGSEIIWLKTDENLPYTVSTATREQSGMKYGEKEKLIRKFGFNNVKEAIERSQATIYSIIPGIKFIGLSKEERLERAKISIADTYRSLGLREENLPTIIKKFQKAEAERRTAGQVAMFKVAELSGGFTGFVEKPQDAEEIYSNIFKVIGKRYIIGYYPINQERHKQRRTIKIEVRNHPEYIVMGQKAYFTR